MAALVCKALRKHGWPADVRANLAGDGFQVLHHETGLSAQEDFWEAVGCAVRIVARTYRVDVSEYLGHVTFNRPYRVGPGGHFREIKG